MKKWYESKTVWYNLIMTVIDIAALVQEVYTDVPEWVLLGAAMIHGSGNVVLRIWFTDKPIEMG